MGRLSGSIVTNVGLWGLMAGEIFISYRRADDAWARLLYDRLKAEGVEAWYDGLVGPGQEWRTATAKALEASQIFVLLFTENAAQSSEIVKELAAATHETASYSRPAAEHRAQGCVSLRTGVAQLGQRL